MDVKLSKLEREMEKLGQVCHKLQLDRRMRDRLDSQLWKTRSAFGRMRGQGQMLADRRIGREQFVRGINGLAAEIDTSLYNFAQFARF